MEDETTTTTDTGTTDTGTTEATIASSINELADKIKTYVDNSDLLTAIEIEEIQSKLTSIMTDGTKEKVAELVALAEGLSSEDVSILELVSTLKFNLTDLTSTVSSLQDADTVIGERVGTVEAQIGSLATDADLDSTRSDIIASATAAAAKFN